MQKGDCAFYVKGRKKPIAYSTAADRDMFNWTAEECNGDLKLMLENLRYSPSVREIVQKYINLGFTNVCEIC